MKRKLMTVLSEMSSAVDYVYSQQKRNDLVNLITSLPNFKSVDDNDVPEEQFLIFCDENGELFEGYKTSNGQIVDFYSMTVRRNKVVYFYNKED